MAPTTHKAASIAALLMSSSLSLQRLLANDSAAAAPAHLKALPHRAVSGGAVLPIHPFVRAA